VPSISCFDTTEGIFDPPHPSTMSKHGSADSYAPVSCFDATEGVLHPTCPSLVSKHESGDFCALPLVFRHGGGIFDPPHPSTMSKHGLNTGRGTPMPPSRVSTRRRMFSTPPAPPSCRNMSRGTSEPSISCFDAMEGIFDPPHPSIVSKHRSG